MEVKLGYKQTEVGVIPEDWDTARLGNKTTKVGSGVTPTGGARVYKQEGRPFLRSQNIGWGILLLDDLAYIDDETHATFRDTEIEADDVLLNITGASIGRSAIADASVEEGNVNQHVCIIRANQTDLYPRFLNYFLLSSAGQKQIDSFQAGGNRQGLNFGQIKSFHLPLPPPQEQHAVVQVLSDADVLIESLEQLLTKKRQIKEGAMQELLAGRKRLPGFSGEWEVKQLGELGSTFSGLTGKTKNDFGHGTSRYITFMNIMANVMIDCSSFEFVDVHPTESQNRVAPGDLFFNGSSETPEEVGMCSLLTQDVQNVYLNSFCFGFRFHDGAAVNGLYIALYFRSQEGRKLLKSLAQGATRYNLSKTALLNIGFPIPQLPEQTAIATVLSDMDAEISALESKLFKARQLKQGMMQELLTGRIRLV